MNSSIGLIGFVRRILIPQMNKGVHIIFKQLRTDLGKYVLSSSILMKFVNLLYEHSSDKWRNFFVHHISFAGAPEIDFVWRLHLSNGCIIKVPIKAGDLKSWQFAQSYKWHEPALRRVEAFLHENIPLCQLFLDVGANLGLRSIYPLAIGRPVILFEPNTYLRAFTEHLFETNGFIDYQISNICLGDRNDSIELFISKSSYMSSVIAEHAKIDGIVEKIEVPVMALDSYIHQNLLDRPIGLLKIDVEGFEQEVLIGAQAGIQKHKPVVIVETQECNELYIFNFFKDLEYEGFLLKDTYHKPLEYLSDMSKNMSKVNNFLYCYDRKLLASLKQKFIV